MNPFLAYVAAAMIALWGVAHVIPTSRVLAGLEPVTADYRRVFTQEWLAEAVAMWGVAAMVIAATATGGATEVRDWV